MSENKTYNSNLVEVLYGSVVGAGRIVGEFLSAALVLPVTFLTVPTAVRVFKNQIKEDFKEAEKQGKEGSIYIYAERLRNHWTTKPIRGIGAVIGGFLVAEYANKAYHFVSEYPYTLAIPVVTNLLSAGYERYASDKPKRLEEKLE